MINGSKKCKEKWTRVNTSNVNEKSVISSKDIYENTLKMLVDEDGEYRITGKTIRS